MELSHCSFVEKSLLDSWLQIEIHNCHIHCQSVKWVTHSTPRPVVSKNTKNGDGEIAKVAMYRGAVEHLSLNIIIHLHVKKKVQWLQLMFVQEWLESVVWHITSVTTCCWIQQADLRRFSVNMVVYSSNYTQVNKLRRNSKVFMRINCFSVFFIID